MEDPTGKIAAMRAPAAGTADGMAAATTEFLARLVEACSAAEAVLADRTQRTERLREVIALLPSVAAIEGIDLTTLEGLAVRAAETGDPRQLSALAVPLERALGRSVRDEDFLPVTDDATRTRDLMPVEIVADSLRSAFNVGGLFRSAECFGAAAIVLTGYSADPNDERVAKAALGTHEAVPWRRAPRAVDAADAARAAERQVVCLETGGSPVAEADLRFPLTFLVGNERHGLDSSIVEGADAFVSVPMHGKKNSLNVVSACAVLLYELRRRWQEQR